MLGAVAAVEGFVRFVCFVYFLPFADAARLADATCVGMVRGNGSGSIVEDEICSCVAGCSISGEILITCSCFS